MELLKLFMFLDKKTAQTKTCTESGQLILNLWLWSHHATWWLVMFSYRCAAVHIGQHYANKQEGRHNWDRVICKYAKPVSQVQKDPQMHIYHFTCIFVVELFTFGKPTTFLREVKMCLQSKLCIFAICSVFLWIWLCTTQKNPCLWVNRYLRITVWIYMLPSMGYNYSCPVNHTDIQLLQYSCKYWTYWCIWDFHSALAGDRAETALHMV